MNQSKERVTRPPNPITNANILSKWCFWWMKDILLRGLKGPIADEDLYEHTKGVESKRLTKNLITLWEDEKEHEYPSVINIIFRVYGSKFIPFSVLQSLVELITQLLQPVFFGYLVSYFFPGQTTTSKHDAYMYALGIIACTFLPIATNNAYIFSMYVIGMKIRIGFAGLMYRKCLKISKSASSESLTSRAISITSTDLPRFNHVLIFLRLLYRGPLEALLTGVLLFREIGWAGLLGLLLMLSFIPFEAWIAKKVTGYRKKFSEGTDARVKLMNEIIQGIQVIKMYAWEKSFAKIVSQVRVTELKGLRGMSHIYAIISCLAVASTLSIFLSLVSYVYLGGTITAKQVFTVSCFFYKLEKSLLELLPVAIAFCSEAYVSANRVRDFLLEVEDLTKDTRRRKSSLRLRRLSKAVDENGELITSFLPIIPEVTERRYYPDAENKSVELTNAFASWEKGNSDRKAIIRNMSLEISENSLVGIVGHVGAGKSTLLNVLLGEVTLSQGMVSVNGLISYAAQDPWLFEGTIRDNIVFVEEFDEERYEKVLSACALNKDLEMLPGGDLTFIGERGISLSGGQKARINLARAVYRDADIYLLDDPLSAVDNNVGKHIFEKCIKEFLAGKIRILVTHQIQYLFDVDQLILMEDGKCVAQGSYQELEESKQFQFLAQKKNEDGTDETLMDKAIRRESKVRNSSIQLEEAITTLIDQAEEKKEKLASGSVNISVYTSYFKAVESLMLTFMIVGLFVLGRVMLTGVDYFISKWVIWEENMTLVHKNLNATIGKLNKTGSSTSILFEENLEFLSEEEAERTKIIIFYAVFLSATVFIIVTKAFSFFNMCLQISLNLHDRLFRGVTRATMSFFKNNSSGRILNRFSKDVRTVDVEIPFTFSDVMNFTMNLASIVFVVSVKNYILIIPALVLLLVLYFIRYVFIRTTRNVKRIEAISQSPVYSHLNETFQGLATIRAFDAEKALQREFHQYQNANTSAWYIFIAASRAFSFWSEMICFVFISAVVLSFLVFENNFSSGDVGFTILQILTIIHMCQWGIRQTSELENYMTSVERILEYADTPSEPPIETPQNQKPADDWPSKGRIEFENVELRYSPNEPIVIKNLSLCIEPKEKIGIVGRTGAGKSSILQSILRLATIEGKITIDGVDIETIGLHDLRSKISIIPQDAVLFSGSLRYNLDPFDTKSDAEIWNALENVELHNYVSDMNAGLGAQICEGGSNFSMGQKQLLCLARAILRKNKILILDEATANVDLETDKLIQKTIRSKFANCTVVTIAHRLDTVIDSDRILVMDKGEAVEFDHPHVLIQKPDGVFLKLVEQAGSETSQLLKEVAKKLYNKKHAKQKEES